MLPLALLTVLAANTATPPSPPQMARAQTQALVQIIIAAEGCKAGRQTGWCGREDSNFHGLSATATSTLRVYQFRHDRTS